MGTGTTGVAAEVPLLDEEQDLDNDSYAWLMSQTWDAPKYTPEVRLRIAVLGEALETLQRNSVRDIETQMDKARAWKWLEGRVKSAPGFSFEEVCELVDLDSGVVRRAVSKLVADGRRVNVRDLIFWLR